MCSRGIFQLRKIKLKFCEFGGSSKGIREVLQGSKLDEFLEKNPHLELEAYISNGDHPYIRTEYINGWSRDLSLRNLNPEEILKVFERVRSQGGHKAFKHSGKKVISYKTSVQGPWRPNMWHSTPEYEDQTFKPLPQFPDFSLKPKTTEEPDPVHKLDKYMRKKLRN